MNDKKSAEVKDSNAEPRFYTLKLFITVVLAFAAGLAFRRSAGIIAMTPLALAICFGTAFIDIGVLTKGVIFAVSVFALNTIETASISAPIIFSALCLLALCLSDYAVGKIKKGAKWGYAVIALGVVVCVMLNLRFVGNPFKASQVEELISDYTERYYSDTANGPLGEVKFSEIYYRYDTKAYVVDVTSSNYRTETVSITVGDKVIADGFKKLMEEKLSTSYVSDFSAILRECFPDGRFNVEFDRFTAIDGESIFSAEDGALAGSVCYEITVGGVQSADEMTKRVNEIVAALDGYGAEYARITFKSGIGTWNVRYVSIDCNHPKFHAVTELGYVSTVGTGRFNEYILDNFGID